MKTMMRAVVAIAMVVGATFWAPSARADQLPVVYAGPTNPEATLRAEELEREARDLFSQPKKYGKASALLQEAATERVLGDPLRVKDLHLASYLAFYKGDKRRALELMTQAADEALAVGDVVVAADNYADAAFLAQEGKRPDAAVKLAKKSALLANSPLIDSKTRAGILARVEVAT